MRFLMFCALFFVSTASAEQVARDQLVQCLAISDEAERLACFERVTRPLVPGDENNDAPEAEPVAAEEPKTDPPAVKQVVKQANEPGKTAPRTDVQPTPGLGAEQLPDARRAPREEKALATVVRVRKGNLGHLFFHLADGSVWRQNEARYYSYPRNREFPIEISKGVMGEYQLRVDGKGPRVRVRRVE